MTSAIDYAEQVSGLVNREIHVGATASYLPLELNPGLPYTEHFDIDPPPVPDTPPFQALFRAGSPLHKETIPVDLPYVKGRNDSRDLILHLDSTVTAQLYALALQDREPIAEWVIQAQLLHDTAVVLARGPVYFRRRARNNRPASWLELSPSTPTERLKIVLKGEIKGEFQDGTPYNRGDIVTSGGKQFMCLCELDGTPGHGPNLDPADPDSNTILLDSWPPDSTTVTADAPDDALAATVTGDAPAAGGSE